MRWLTMVLIVALTGCVGFSRERLSRADEDGRPTRFQTYAGRMQMFEGVEMAISTSNSTRKTWMIFPVPWYSPESPVAGSVSVWISIIARKDGLSFSPQDLVYTSPEGESFTPASLVGPFSCKTNQPHPPAAPAPLSPFPLPLSQCYTMVVRFDAPQSDPAQTFHLVPGALLVDGQKTTLPKIRFSEDRRGQTFGIPS